MTKDVHPYPMKIAIPDFIELLEDGKQQLRSLGEVTLFNDVPAAEADIISRIKEAELIIPSIIDVNATVIENSPHLKYIVVPGIGYDQIDIKAAQKAGIAVVNCPTHNVPAVAEFTIGLIFAITRKILESHLFLSQGNWKSPLFQGTEIQGKTLGLIGYGNIGKAVEKLAIALGMKVMHASSSTPPQELDRLIASVDILSLHLPLTPQSKGLIDERRLHLMKPDSYLINTARGAIVDQKALFFALKEKRIAGAALDVFVNEPIAGTVNPEILEFTQLSNVVATCHIAYNSIETAMRLADELTQNIQACTAGTPINVVN